MSQDYFTIKELTKYLKQKFDSDAFLKNVSLRGEISNFTHHSRGHFYFTLKDEFSQISAIMFSSSASKIKFKPVDGTEVIVRGYISVYEATGKYQIYVNKMEEFGKGSIQVEFEKLKAKLLKDGKLDDKFKQKLPKYPEVIGVITSPTGAAVRDIYNTINRRYPLARIDFFPTLVQGDNSKHSIIKSIIKANEMAECDVLIVGRGGGSIEDLWAFNEEIVANAIFESKIPIISAVGHETDFTIADYIADLRAPTPTAAAELAVPDRIALMQQIINVRRHLDKTLNNVVVTRVNKLNYLSNSRVLMNPERLFDTHELKLDNLISRVNSYSPIKIISNYKDRITYLNEKIQSMISHELTVKNNEYESLKLRLINIKDNLLNKHLSNCDNLENKLILLNPINRINRQQDRLESLSSNLESISSYKFKTIHNKFLNTIDKLSILNPLNKMKKGYSIATISNKIIESVDDVHIGDLVELKVNDGLVNLSVKSKRKGEDNE